MDSWMFHIGCKIIDKGTCECWSDSHGYCLIERERDEWQFNCLSHSLFIFSAKYNIYSYINAFSRHFHPKRFTIEEHKQFVSDELAENVFVTHSWGVWL